MYPPGPHGRGRLVAAIVVSLSVHALVGLAWLNSRGPGSAAGPDVGVTVDGPEDSDVAFVLRDRPAERLPTLPPVGPVSPPTLPADLFPPTTTVPGAVAPVSASTEPPSHLPNFGGAKSLHGHPKPGFTIVYVLDSSASMGPDGLLRRAANVVRASLAELTPDMRFQIVAYNGGARSMSPEPLPATAEAKERADRWLATLTAEGGSKHALGFRDALAAKPDELYLLTDADDLEESDVRAIAAMIRTPVRLSAAVFRGHPPAAVSPLERLVGRFNGSVRYVEP